MNTFAISAPRLPTIAISLGLRPFVRRAAEDVAGDIGKIFGARPAIVEGDAPASNAIVLRKAGDGWENYAIESKLGNVLEITGSDDHGVMFGLYRFASECLGVDPFYRWSGHEPAKTAERTWESIAIRQGDPSFRFRGWFINDEDFINGFRPEENGKREIDYPLYHVCFGPSMAEEIYETAVRAGFARCLEQLERASRAMDEVRRRQLFERFGYPAEFLRLTSDIYAELFSAVEAKDADDGPCALRRARAAVELGHERDALDTRYNSGKWARWYDRDLKYPCHAVMEELERNLAKEPK